MKAKFFTAESLEEANEKACQFFNTSKENIFTVVKRQGSEVLPWLILAYSIEGTGVTALENVNGSFKLYYESDGVYLEIYPSRGRGLKLNREDVSAYVQRKNIRMLNTTDMLKILEEGEGQAKIAPPQGEILLGEDVVVLTEQSDMEGYIIFLPPDKGGSSISMEEVKEKIKKSGVLYGIDESALQKAVEEKQYGKKYLIARAILPEDGKDGYLEYHFHIGPRSAAPKVDEKGRVDYRNLDLFESVKEGQLLVTRHLATQGVPGKTIRGSELQQRVGKEVLMPRSKNTILNDNKTAMYAKQSGMVEFIGGCLTVSNVYTVKGDCDMGVGNIDFDGSVIIQGNVISGLTIKASGSITIYGVVEGSEIISGSNIELKRGIQGMDKGKLIAEGSVYAQFIERATIVAGVDVIADSIIHSNIEAGRAIIATGKRGNIMGGNIKATSEITTRVLGSVMNTITEIEVGIVPQVRKRYDYLKKEVEKIKEEIIKLDKLEQYLGRSNMTRENADKILASAKNSRYLNNQLLEEYAEELKRLEFDMSNATAGKVHVFDTVYPGCRITIANAIYRVIEPITFTTFKYSNGEVIFTPCEGKAK